MPEKQAIQSDFLPAFTETLRGGMSLTSGELEQRYDQTIFSLYIRWQAVRRDQEYRAFATDSTNIFVTTIQIA